MKKTSQQRKEESIAYLINNNIPYLESLPFIEDSDTVKLRDVEEIVQRAIALGLIANYSLCHLEGTDTVENKRGLLNAIEHYNALAFFTEKERAFIFNDNIDEQQAIQFVWQFECVYVLLWALSLIIELKYPDEICSVPEVMSFIFGFDDINTFNESVQLKDVEDIIDQADLIYRLDWACVEARIKNVEITEVNSEIILERHRALNWLICYDDANWDDVTMDT